MSDRSLSNLSPGVTLPFLGVVAGKSVVVILATLPILCAATERLLFALPKVLMRLSHRLVRLPAGAAEASSDMIEAEPELTFFGEKGGGGISSPGGGVGRILLRPQDFRREAAECMARCSVESRFDGVAAGVASRGGRKACETGVGVGTPRVWLISMRDSCKG